MKRDGLIEEMVRFDLELFRKDAAAVSEKTKTHEVKEREGAEGALCVCVHL